MTSKTFGLDSTAVEALSDLNYIYLGREFWSNPDFVYFMLSWEAITEFGEIDADYIFSIVKQYPELIGNKNVMRRLTYFVGLKSVLEVLTEEQVCDYFLNDEMFMVLKEPTCPDSEYVFYEELLEELTCPTCYKLELNCTSLYNKVCRFIRDTYRGKKKVFRLKDFSEKFRKDIRESSK